MPGNAGEGGHLPAAEMSASGASEEKCALKECQKEAWKEHKTSCREELDVEEVWVKVADASKTSDWEGVLAWEGKMEALLAGAVDDEARVAILDAFGVAHTETQQHGKVASCYERQVDVLGTMELFRDQAFSMAIVSHHLHKAGDIAGARKWVARASHLAREHAFFETQCQSSIQLGILDLTEGHHEEGIDNLRHALTVIEFVEDEEKAKYFELDILYNLFKALMKHPSGDPAELEPLLCRFEEKAKASSTIPLFQHFRFLAHDLRMTLHGRHGDMDAAQEELEAMAELARRKHKEAGEVFNLGLLHPSSPTGLLLKGMRDKGEI